MGYPPDMMHHGGYHGMRESDMHRMMDMGRHGGPPGGMGGYDPYSPGFGGGRPAGCYKYVTPFFFIIFLKLGLLVVCDCALTPLASPSDAACLVTLHGNAPRAT
jgi:hypothetical protein